MADIKKTITDFTKNLSKSSSGLVNSAKLNIKLANEEENLKGVYISIGEKVKEIYSYGATLGEFFDEKYSEILQLEKSIDQIRRDIESAKGLLPCPHCGKYVPKNAAFCPKCGLDVLKEAKESQKEADVLEFLEIEKAGMNAETEKIAVIKTESLEMPATLKTCSICGKENDATEKFCLSCGRLL